VSDPERVASTRRKVMTNEHVGRIRNGGGWEGAPVSQGPEQPRHDQDSEPTSPAGAASPQAEQADDKEQSEGDPDKP
jgi:hypothetical protein